MNGMINLILDIALIALVTAGLVQATRLIQHLAGLREGRIDMERFVKEFNAVVIRAEAGIQSLRYAARESGNDLEKMIDKATLMRDELHIHYRKRRQDRRTPHARMPSAIRPAAAGCCEQCHQKASRGKRCSSPKAQEPLSASQASRAERELLQALEKLG